MGQEGKLELQPGVGTGMVEEADIFSLEERHRQQARPWSLPENLKFAHLGGQVKGPLTLPPSGLRKGQRTLGSGMYSLLPLSIHFTPPP